jgi:hypothetical protein
LPLFGNKLSEKNGKTAKRVNGLVDSADNPDVSLSRPNPKMVRRLLYALLVLSFAVPCFAQRADIDKLLTAEILKVTLYAKTADERRFCEYVIQKRNDGTIPSRLIYGVHQKALTKDKTRRFAYFKIGLEILCAREGIALYPASVQR